MQQDETTIRHGGCLCGAVRYRVRGPIRPVVACHCGQCRRTSGNFLAATRARADQVTIDDSGALTWYRSSDRAERGFCGTCGGNLFWRPVDGRSISIMAGSLDPPTGLDLVCHIYTDDKSDYYRIADGLPQHDGRGPPGAVPDIPDREPDGSQP